MRAFLVEQALLPVHALLAYQRPPQLPTPSHSHLFNENIIKLV